ncbi:MAG: pentapeptide repeat-containing protein, partial [Thermosynechococcaceae cyanobacterium]
MRRGVCVTAGAIALASLAVPAMAKSQGSFNGNQADVTEGHSTITPAEGSMSPQFPQLPTLLAQASPDVGQLVQSKSCKGCNFSNANLSGLDLSGANLSGANLSNADLSNTNLTGADLTGANLYIAKLANSTLTNAKLANTNWTGAKAEQVNLSGADLSDSTLGYANLTGANLMGANLSRVSAGDATFSGANFNQANLTGAKLRNANLSGATFSQANLTNAELINADLSNADLKEANVAGANLAGAQLIQARLPEGTDATTLATTPPSPTGTTPGTTDKTAYTPTPLEKPPIRLFNLETANQQPAGAITFNLGLRNFLNSQGRFGKGGGLGRQVNPFHFDWGVSDRWQVSLSGNLFSDKLLRNIGNNDDPVTNEPGAVELKYFSGAAAVKYQFLKQEKLALSVLG